MQDLVGVGVADAAKEAWISEGPFERVIFLYEDGAKGVEICTKNINAAGIKRAQARFTTHDMQRSPVLCTCFSQDQGTLREIKCREAVAPNQPSFRIFPVQTAGNHQVQDQPNIFFGADGDALAD